MVRGARAGSVLAVLAAVVLGAACGEDGPDRQAYLGAVRADLVSDADGDLAFGEEAATCLAEAIVTATDPERLDARDITPEELAAARPLAALDLGDVDEVRRELASSVEACPTARPILGDVVANFPFAVPDEGLGCMVDALEGTPDLAEAVAAVLVDDDAAPLADAVSTGIAACPPVLLDRLLSQFVDAGYQVDDAARRCFTREVAAGGGDAVRRLLGPEAATVGEELAEACLLG